MEVGPIKMPRRGHSTPGALEGAGLAVSGAGADVRRAESSQRAANFASLQKRVSALIEAGALPKGTVTDAQGSLLVPGVEGRVHLGQYESTAKGLGIELP